MTNTEKFPELPAPIAKALVDRGFTELTPVQRAVVEAESEGRDLRISSRTGSGKTVAIGLALAAHFLERPATSAPRAPGDSAAHPRALVIVPTRELAAQVREELRWLFAGLPAATVEVVTGGTAILRERVALSRRPAFVVGTPGRLLDHMRNGALACDAIEHVILDEADQMLDMGFKEELDAILEQLPEQRSSHLVSATFPRAVQALADRFQKDALALEGTKLGAAHPDIEHVAHAIRRHETYAALVNVLLLAGDSRCLLFVNRRVDATELAEKLAADGFGAAPFSGELPQAQRTRTLNAFRSGLLPILVSTDVAARGIDVPEISTVIHVDPPRNPDAYVHRSGRTGRAGLTGRSILLVEASDCRRVGRMLAAARVPVAWQPVPRAEEVGKALDAQARRALSARLVESSPSEPQRMAAKQLLVEHDPIELVASLVELAKPRPPRDPMAVEGLDPFVDERRGKRGRPVRERRDARDVRDGPPTREAHPPRDERGTPRATGPRRERPAAGAFTPFTVSWGESAGASKARLLSHVCRRGELESHQVGAIRVFGKSSIVEIASDVADVFEARTRRPDERDPGIAIERAASERPRPALHRPEAAKKRRSLGEEAARALERHAVRKPPFEPRRAPHERPKRPRSTGHDAGEAAPVVRTYRREGPGHGRRSEARTPDEGAARRPSKAGARRPSKPHAKPHGRGPRKSGPAGPRARERR